MGSDRFFFDLADFLPIHTKSGFQNRLSPKEPPAPLSHGRGVGGEGSNGWYENRIWYQT